MDTRDHRKVFDAAAGQYATDRYPGRGQCAKLVLDFLAPQSDDLILDVGCGPGEQLISIYRPQNLRIHAWQGPKLIHAKLVNIS